MYSMEQMRFIVQFYCAEQEIICPTFRTKSCILDWIQNENLNLDQVWERRLNLIKDMQHPKYGKYYKNEYRGWI